MPAKPKDFKSSGYTGQHTFKLKQSDRRRLQSSNSLTDDDIVWVEGLMRRYNVMAAQSEAKPTPAQVRAALSNGANRVEQMLSWLQNLDDESRDMLEITALEMGVPLPELTNLRRDLTSLDDAIEVAKRQTGTARPGNTAKSLKGWLAGQIVERFGIDEAYDILRALLPDTQDYLRRLIGRTETD